jgi:hypothetical protein
MDHKEWQLLLAYASRIIGDVFDETDVLTYLVLLRAHAPALGITREFGHFLIHRERDRGEFHSYLCEQLRVASAAVETDASAQSIARAMTSAALYHEAVILADLNAVGMRSSLPMLPEARAEGVAACLLSLLQDARVIDKHGALVGKMVAAFNEERLVLLGQMKRPPGADVLIPILGVPNRYQPFSPLDAKHVANLPNRAFSLLRVAGKLVMHSE